MKPLGHQVIELSPCKIRDRRQVSNMGQEVLVGVADLLNVIVYFRSDGDYEERLKFMDQLAISGVSEGLGERR